MQVCRESYQDPSQRNKEVVGMTIEYIVTALIKHNNRVEKKKEAGNTHPGKIYPILACKRCSMIQLPIQYRGLWTTAYNPDKIDRSKDYITETYCPDHRELYALRYKSMPHPLFLRQ